LIDAAVIDCQVQVMIDKQQRRYNYQAINCELSQLPPNFAAFEFPISRNFVSIFLFILAMLCSIPG